MKGLLGSILVFTVLVIFAGSSGLVAWSLDPDYMTAQEREGLRRIDDAWKRHLDAEAKGHKEEAKRFGLEFEELIRRQDELYRQGRRRE